MRRLLPFAIIGGLGIVYLWQQHTQKPATSNVKPATAALTPSPVPHQTVSEHNWMKRSMDRAADVAQKARAQTKESQDP